MKRFDYDEDSDFDGVFVSSQGKVKTRLNKMPLVKARESNSKRVDKKHREVPTKRTLAYNA